MKKCSSFAQSLKMNTTILVIGIIVLVIGIIMIIIGISLHSYNVQNNNGNQPWYVWFLIIGGIVIAIIGGFAMAFSSTRSKRIGAAYPPKPGSQPPPVQQFTSQQPLNQQPYYTTLPSSPGIYPGTNTAISNTPLAPAWSGDNIPYDTSPIYSSPTV